MPWQVGLQITPSGIALAKVLLRKNEQPTLLTLAYRASSDRERASVIAGLMSEYKLENTPTHINLAQKTYQLMMVDSLDVEKKELKEALKWKLHDLLSFPVEEAILDYFDIPAQRSNDGASLGFAVIVKTNIVLDLQSTVREAGFQVSSVDIPEMAMRNLVRAAGFGEEPTVIVRVTHRGGSVLYMKDKMLFMQRSFDLGLDLLLDSDFDDNEEVHALQENLALEVQRSIDYAMSYLGQPSATKIIMMPLSREKPKLLEFIHNTLGVECLELDLNKIFKTETEINRELQSKCLFALGVALREHGDDYATTN